MKIEIKNYQRIEEIEINLSPGINLITGSSNNGKSSTIRAVRDFVFNKFSNDKIKHGENKIEVNLDSVKSSRTKSGTTFDINGQHMEKVGRNALQEVYDIFKIGELDVNGVNIKPNFWFQMDKPFLFDKTPGQKHDLIIGSKNDKYLKALKSIKNNQNYLSKTELKSLKDSINLLKKQNLDMQIAIDNLNGIDILFKELESLEKEKTFFVNIKTIIEDLKKTNANFVNIKSKLKIINELILDYEINKSSFSDLEKNINIVSMLDKHNQEKINLNALSEKNKKVDDLLIESETVISNIKEFLEDDKKINNLKSMVSDFRKIETDILSNKENSISIDKEIETKETKIIDIKKELKYCPTCKKEF